MFSHCSPIQSSFAFFMPFLICRLTVLYSIVPSASFLFFFFFNSLRLSHRSRISAVTHGFLTGRCFPRISLAVSVTAALKVSVNVSKSMSLSSMGRAANFPPIIAWKTSATCGSFSLSTSNLILACPCFLVLFKCSYEGHHNKLMIASKVGSWKAAGLGDVHT